MTFENNILEVLVEGFVSPILQNVDIDRVPTQPGKREKSVKLNIALPALEKSLN